MTLSTEQLRDFETRLRDEKKHLEDELSTVGRKDPENPADWEPMPDKLDIQRADPNESADALEEYDENSAILRELEIQLVEVNAALARIADGSYGQCESDGKPIDLKRLDANPSARTCIAHATNHKK